MISFVDNRGVFCPEKLIYFVEIMKISSSRPYVCAVLVCCVFLDEHLFFSYKRDQIFFSLLVQLCNPPGVPDNAHIIITFFLALTIAHKSIKSLEIPTNAKKIYESKLTKKFAKERFSLIKTSLTRWWITYE